MLIKPSNAVNRLLPRLLELHPAAKGILLHGTLEDFLVSCCKKLPSAVAPMRWMVRYVLTGMLERNLQIPQEHEFSFAEACVLTWHAQIELYAKALADDHHQQLRSIGMQDLLWNPESSVRACSRWLGMASGEDLAARVEQVFSHDSKRPDAVHGQKRREAERDSVLAQHGRLIDAALAWSEQVVALVAYAPSDWKQLQS